MKIIALFLSVIFAASPFSALASDCNFDLNKLETKIKKNVLILCRDYKPLVIPACAKTQIDELDRGKTKMRYYKVAGLKTYIEGFGKGGLQTINIRKGEDFWAIFGIDSETGKVNKIRVRGEKEFAMRSSCGKHKATTQK